MNETAIIKKSGKNACGLKYVVFYRENLGAEIHCDLRTCFLDKKPFSGIGIQRQARLL